MINKKLKINTESLGFRVFQMVRTFCCFMGGRLLTTPGSLQNTGMVIKNLIFNFDLSPLVNEQLWQLGMSKKDFLLIAICFVILWCVSMMQERFSVREKLAQQNIVVRWIVVYAAIFSIIIFGIYGPGYDAAAFIYTQY